MTAPGPGLRFRTPYIEELPTGHQNRAPGFAWVAVSSSAPTLDPAKNWGTTNKKRARGSGIGSEQTESQKEALNAKQQRQIDRKIKDLNSDSKDVVIPGIGGGGGGGGGSGRQGKTTKTKKILNSGKTFAHYVEDEEAEIALKGRRDGDGMPGLGPKPDSQRASKTPLHRRKPQPTMLREESSMSSSPAPTTNTGNVNANASIPNVPPPPMPMDDEDEDMDGMDEIDPLPTEAEMLALLNAPPLTYNQARSLPPPTSAPPPRQFCETCGYWGRVKCMKCGNMTCSVTCKEAHDEHKCLKFYA